MLQYLVILLDDSSTSFCHYDSKDEHNLISIEDLKEAIFFGMKENLMIQFVYPDYPLPQVYLDTIESIDHSKIMSSKNENSSDADVVIIHSLGEFSKAELQEGKVYTLQITIADFNQIMSVIKSKKANYQRLNIVLKDVDKCTENDLVQYKNILQQLAIWYKEQLYSNNILQINLLSDRIMLDKMNNCEAGNETITLAPNGKFYVCPAFYYDNPEDSVGDLKRGLDIRNPQLYKIGYAPICRICDAYQCKRCIWLNKKTTLEVNTPSHEQCVAAHLERNASRNLLGELQNLGVFEDKSIPELDYLDPFDKANNWK
ncbi:MAG: CXXX repeat peptide maturase [Bacteroidetes bacterium]|nr:CXXX repeat peptide maturase [Bacteroidota bacterium]